MKILFHNFIEVLIILGLISLLSGCSLSGKMVLYNALESTILIKPIGELHEDRDYERVGSSTTREINLNLDIEHMLKIYIENRNWCYQLKVVDLSWVGKGPKIFVKLGKDYHIYIYPKESKEDSFYTKSLPVQPDGYPLVPSACTK